MPGENRIGFDNGGDVFEGLLAEFSADLGEGLTFAIREPYASFNPVAQDTILNDEILVAQ
jgi:hypothetical protein